MKMNVSFNAIAVSVFFLSLIGSSKIYAQRYLSEKKPDLVLLAVTAKKENVNQLNVIWSIKNTGDATATDFGNLVAFNVESSTKANRPGETHNWVLRGSRIPLNLSKNELKPGEIINGSTLLPHIEQDFVSLRLTLDFNDDFYESKKDNNAFIAQLVGK